MRGLGPHKAQVHFISELWQFQISELDCQGCADACVVFPLYGVFSPVIFYLVSSRCIRAAK